MMTFTSSAFVLLASALAPAFASPIGSRDVPDQCAVGSNPDPSCFQALGLNNWITYWSALSDCNDFAGFADCWYAKMTPYAPSQCSVVSANPACEQPKWIDFTGDDAAQNFYVTWAIWNTNALFLNMFDAIGAAESNVNGLIGGLVEEFDPPQPEDTILEYILDALTFGLSLYSEGSVLVKALIRSAPQTSSLVSKLFPTGSNQQQISSWTEAETAITQFSKDWQTSLGQGLPLIVNDAATFATWGDNSDITGSEPDLSGLTTSIGQALGAAAISSIFSSIGLVVSRAPDTDVHALQTNGTAILWDTGCEDGYDSAGICNTYFWDGTDTYAITNPNNWLQNYHDELEYILGGDDPITTGEILFTGAHDCFVSCGTNGGCSPSLDSNDPTSFSCLSNMRTCTWHEDNLVGPFTDCDNIGDPNPVLVDWGIFQCPNGPANENSWDVPLAYLGSAILTNGPWSGAYVCNDADEGQ